MTPQAYTASLKLPAQEPLRGPEKSSAKIFTEGRKIILIFSIFQIILLINFTIAQSYNLNSEEIKINSEISEISKKIIKSSLNLVVGFLSINQIGFVSATTCCEKTTEGAFCQEDVLQEDCDTTNVQSDCGSTTFCKLGDCIGTDGLCSALSPRITCEENNGEWFNEADECTLGCCQDLGTNTQYNSQAWCDLQGGIFDDTIPEELCGDISSDANGACVYQVNGENNCEFNSGAECIESRTFHEGSLCSNEGLDTICTKQESINCLDEKIYWFDSCGNMENVYEGNTPALKDESWNQGFVKIVGSQVCTIDVNNPNNLDTCGNCDSVFNTCKPVDSSETHVAEDNFVCADLSCVDETDNNKERKNGESWCVYEGQVGEYINDETGVQISSDIPGSSHYRKSCIQGEITTINCGVYRENICGEHAVEIGEGESAISYTEATCRPNMGLNCFGIENVEDCEDESDCRMQNINVVKDDEVDFFKFDVCVPKYPQGFNPIYSAEDDESVCSFASMSCPIIQQYKAKCVAWEPIWGCLILERVYLDYIANKECDKNPERFYSQMNDFCVSLGDCAGYVNTVGNYTGKDSLKERYVRINNTPEENNSPTFANLASSLGSSSSTILNLINSQLGEIECVEIEGEQVCEETLDEGSRGLLKFRQVNQVGGLIGIYANYIVTIVAAIIELVVFNWQQGDKIGKLEKSEVSFSCEPWEPPARSQECDKCNEGEFPCTEYKCWSLGKNCEVLVEEEGVATDEVICVKKELDPTPPVINFNVGSFSGDLTTTIQSNGALETGIIITNNSNENGCVEGNTLLNFNLTTDKDEENKFARCIWGTAPSDLTSYKTDWIGRPTSGFVWTKENNFEIRVASFSDNCLGEDGEFNVYVRCEGHEGNAQLTAYNIQMCVNPTPDIRPPIIKEFSPEDGSYLIFGNDTLDSPKIYANEPLVECGYSFDETTNYEDMTKSLFCEGYIRDDDSCFPRLKYGCDFADITGLSTSDPNKLYFKCNDTQGNVNIAYKEYTINPSISTLKITSATPTEYNQVSSATGDYEMTLRVTTSGGADGTGIAKCYFPSGDLLSSDLDPQLEFFDTDTTMHTQNLFFVSGDYNIPIMCEDSTGNVAEESIVFTLEIDNTSPEIAVIYRSGSLLGIETHKKSRCYYNNDILKKCNFEMNTTTLMEPGFEATIEHYVEWNSEKTYYIKCKDNLENVGTCVSISPSAF
ncbi:MAG: hypothetical protein ABFQ65_00515 [Nanoarchaeota archaeon]